MRRRLFTNECEVRSLENLTLTTHRVIAYDKHRRGEASTSLLLDQVQWTRLVSGSPPWLLAITAAVGIIGLAALVDGSLRLGAFTVGLLLITSPLHAVWRRFAVVIGSGDARIKAWLGGDRNRYHQARSFLDAVDRAAAIESPRRPSFATSLGPDPMLESTRGAFDARYHR